VSEVCKKSNNKMRMKLHVLCQTINNNDEKYDVSTTELAKHAVNGKLFKDRTSNSVILIYFFFRTCKHNHLNKTYYQFLRLFCVLKCHYFLTLNLFALALNKLKIVKKFQNFRILCFKCYLLYKLSSVQLKSFSLCFVSNIEVP
jgi:hypothetical protein